MKRGQSSVEFVFLSSVMLLFFAISIVYVQQLLVDYTGDSKVYAMEQAADAVEAELARAARLPDGYERSFHLPYSVQGLPYTIELQDEPAPRKDAIVITAGGEKVWRFTDQQATGSLQPGLNVVRRRGTLLINVYENTPVMCSDSLDNDADGSTDYADASPGYQGQSCNLCDVASCNIAIPGSVNATCGSSLPVIEGQIFTDGAAVRPGSAVALRLDCDGTSGSDSCYCGACDVANGYGWNGTACSIFACRITTTCTDTEVLSLQSAHDTHAGLPGVHSWSVCCKATLPLDTTCSDAVLARLSGPSNAHAEVADIESFGQDICLSSSTGTVSCRHDTACLSTETCVMALSNTEDAHVGDCSSAFGTKVCCSFT